MANNFIGTCLTTALAEWNTATNWSLGHVPTSSEDTTFTGIAAPVVPLTITTTAAVAKSIDFSTAGAAFTLSGSVAIGLYGSLICKTGMTWAQTGGIYQQASGNIDTNGTTITSAWVVMSGSTCTLINNNYISTKEFYVRGGNNLTSNSLRIDTLLFTDGGVAGAVTLNLGTSTINCTNVSFAAATVTTTAGMSPTINLTSTVDVTANFGGVDWHETSVVAVITNSKALSIAGATTTVANFAVSWTAAHQANQLLLGGDLAIAGIFQVTGSPTFNHPIIRSSTVGTQRTITAGTVTIAGGAGTSVDFQDIKGAGAADWDLSGIASGDCGGNYTNSPKLRAPAIYYYAGTTGNFSYNRWSIANDSSADGTAVFPLTQDTATFTDTGVTAGATVTVDMTRCCGINTAGLTDAMSLVFGTGRYYGSLDLTGTNLTVTSTGVTLTADARVATTLSVNAVPAIGSGSITVDSYGGTVRLLTNNLTHTGTLTHTRGTLDTNGKLWTCNILSSSNSNTRVLQDTGGGGAIVQTAVTGTVIDMSTDTGLTFGAAAPTFTLGNSALTLTGNVTANFGASVAKTMAGLNLKKHAGDFPYIILGIGNNFGAVVPETPDATYQFNKIQWGNSASQKNVTSFNATGHASYPIYIQSDSAGVPAHLTDTNAGTNTFVNCNIKDMHVTGGVWDATGAGNTDVSGNEGWLFGLCKILVGSAWKAATAKIMVGGAWKTVTSVKKMVSGAWKA
jgi:hypothetical protein